MQTSALGSTSTSSSGSTSAVPTQTLDENDFLKLLMAQLQNQDPTAPVDDQQFAAELAQFSSLQELQTIGQQIGNLASAQSAANQMETTGLVGKGVVFSTSQVPFDGANPVTLAANLPSAASSATVAVTDSAGNVVRTLSLGAEPAGMNGFTWDGKDNSGNTVAAGTYNIAITASDANGQTLNASVLEEGTVTAVTYSSSDSSSPVLIVGNQQVSLTNVVQVVNPGA
ncbi:MAG TPA: FlgD immunoglobulin-like domain containing protein [Anaeromyxobacteraceae bacterium]|nr:FlgD immunoglobulin-like domain containing protein [Anaeromyxobacteraceae bacterium]